MAYADYLEIGHAPDVAGPGGRRLYRLLEMLPGILAWATLLGVVVFAFAAPAAAAVFIIAFDVYWLIKTIYLSVHMNASFRKMRANQRRPWSAELLGLRAAAPELGGIGAGELHHLVILPFYREPHRIVRESVLALLGADWPKERMIVVLAAEARAGAEALKTAQDIRAEFGDRFLKFLVTVHPSDIPGELAGKGSNERWAGKHATAAVDGLGIPHERVIVSVFDIDTVVPAEFFACLAWHYLTEQDPLHASFQPVPVFTNNIWEAPAFARVFAFSTTFWQMIQQARPEQLVTFSSQSIGLKAVVDVGYWQANVVSEDSQIFWKCLLRYDGRWRTVPLHFPVFMDANVAPTFWGTFRNQYLQIRRWHYGVENNPYFMYGFLQNRKMPRSEKLRHTFQMLEKSHSSATSPLIIFLLGWLPLLFGGSAFSQSVLSFHLPILTRNIMLLAMVGLVSSAAISLILMPPRPSRYGPASWLWMIVQWLLFPVNFIVFGAVPALDAQTRLMLGKYMGFWVTPKHRRDEPLREGAV
ncbi:MAG TPA: glycosyltransferase family 2 protein [Candidatus Paceibacterota bacterium]|nr:glycosyltransferase family 2 protein [Candidatus Paceibacterota bacterium]